MIGLFASTGQSNLAASWSPVLPIPYVSPLLADPLRPWIIYAAGQGGLYKTFDAGETWNRTGFLSLDDPWRAFAMDSFHPDVLYSATTWKRSCSYLDPRLIKSTDSGATWTDVYTRFPIINGCGEVHAIVLDRRTDPNTVYVSSFEPYEEASGLAKSPDGGETWIDLAAPLLATLAIDPSNSSVLYGGTVKSHYNSWAARGVIKSSDGGQHWQNTGLDDAEISLITIDPNNPSTLYAEASTFPNTDKDPGLYKSTDFGASWFRVNNGLAHPRDGTLTALIVDPNNSSVLYAGVSPGGVFKSLDGAMNWNSFSEGLADLNVRSLTIAPGSTTTLFAATNVGVYRAYDNVPLLSMDSARYCIGYPWKLTLVNVPATAVIRLLGSSNGALWEVSEWRKTDLDGRSTESGVFSASTSGNHTLQVEVIGARSNRLSFVVSNCAP
jgi:hypothetical protein